MRKNMIFMKTSKRFRSQVQFHLFLSAGTCFSFNFGPTAVTDNKMWENIILFSKVLFSYGKYRKYYQVPNTPEDDFHYRLFCIRNTDEILGFSTFGHYWGLVRWHKLSRRSLKERLSTSFNVISRYFQCRYTLRSYASKLLIIRQASIVWLTMCSWVRKKMFQSNNR